MLVWNIYNKHFAECNQYRSSSASKNHFCTEYGGISVVATYSEQDLDFY